MAFTWSYSSLGLFQQCPRKYYRLRVLKDIVEPEAEHLTYGKLVHEAAELHIRDNVPVPEKYSFLTPVLDVLKAIPGEKHCEYKMGLTADLEPCDFFDPKVWCRGVADLLVVNEENGSARVVDYKTSKSAKYADTAQLELMALMVFKHFPKVRRVKAGLLFVVANDFKKAEYVADQEKQYWRTWMQDVVRLETAHKTGVWNPTKTGLCKKHCVVTTCPHNGVNS